MDRLFLEVPSLERKDDAIDFLNEHVIYKSELNGTGGLNKCLQGLSYESWLEEIKKRENLEYVKSINRVQSKTFFVVRESDNLIVGMINIRYNIPQEVLNTWGSHIGYGIRPTQRQKGYAKRALYLALIEEQKMGEKNVLLDCTVDNIGSNKTILALGGVFDKAQIDETDGEYTNYYWIDVEKSLEDNYETYKDLVKTDYFLGR